ncbi:hypothetical protein SEA_BADGER_84 [Mycobacterium phage Badger]|nr:hypothetical protein SEA_BADGER_84 [Mycobacterium phage Badger]
MQCDYCGGFGHDWSVHPEARADVRSWESERNRLEFPFGDYRGE